MERCSAIEAMLSYYFKTPELLHDGAMEDFLIPDRDRIAASLRGLARVDRGQRGGGAPNGRAARPRQRLPAGLAARLMDRHELIAIVVLACVVLMIAFNTVSRDSNLGLIEWVRDYLEKFDEDIG